MKIGVDLLDHLFNRRINLSNFVKKLTLLGFESFETNGILDINIPYNRFDCNSVLGILKEIYNCKDITSLISFDKNKYVDYAYKNIKINISDVDFCPIYMCKILQNIDLEQQLPVYIVNTLLNNNIKIINPIVDIINYVFLLFGHPLHGYNLQSIDYNINLCKLTDDFDFYTINNEKIKIKNNTFLIKSKNNIIAIPGVIGSYCSRITNNTTNILLESAFFKSNYIKYICDLNNINTDSSKYFVNQINFKIVEPALHYASNLIAEIFYCKVSETIMFINKNYLPVDKKINIHKKKILSTLGFYINDFNINLCAKRLGFFFKNCKRNLVFRIPEYRTDLKIEENVIAELIKIYGYNNIIKIPFKINSGSNNKLYTNFIDVKSVLINNGFNEIITYSFIDYELSKIFYSDKKEIFIKNPLSEKMNVMRKNLFCGLLTTAAFNLNRQNHNLRLFEIGNTYFYCNNEIKYINTLSVIMTKKNYNSETFFLLKKILENIVLSIYKINNLILSKADYNFFDHNINANIIINDKNYGCIGLINKEILNYFAIKQKILAFTINLDNERELFIQKFIELSKYPSSIRDLSIIVKKNIIYDDVFVFIKNLNILNLIKIVFIDCYDFKNEDKQSITFRFKFQSMTSTLLDKDINISMDLIQNSLKSKFFAEIKLK